MSGAARIIPVLDILGGVVVRAMGGLRHEYRPLESPLIPSPEPLSVARALRERFGFTLFYLADLDAIMGAGDNRDSVAGLARDGFTLWVDAGYQTLQAAPKMDGVTPVFATETFIEWERMERMAGAVISIDTREGRLLTARKDLPLETILRLAREKGAQRFIHLRLDAVGLGLFDASALIPPGPGEEWYAGGGARGREDMAALVAAGYAGALISTALHNGSLP